MARRSHFLAAASLLVALASAGAAAPGIPRAVPTAKLGLMPLPLAAYGREAGGLRLDADQSGVIDNAEAAQYTTDRKDSAASLRAAGRITGFDVAFANYGLIGKPGNLAYVSSGVELYGNDRQASAGVARSDLTRTEYWACATDANATLRSGGTPRSVPSEARYSPSPWAMFCFRTVKFSVVKVRTL